jgi:hypothetical protein
MIIAVSGPPGAGKTDWIARQIANNEGKARYFSLQMDAVSLDAIYLASEFPNLDIISPDKGISTNQQVNLPTYIEIPWQLNLLVLEPWLQQLKCHRVAIVPKDSYNTEWHKWAQEVIYGNEVKIDSHVEIDRGILTGEILEFNSLEVFWYEVTTGAYGDVIRVKGIFDVEDGQCIYGDFLKGLPEKEFQLLNLPVCSEGRPQRYSGFELIGTNLDRMAIASSLKYCCLNESAIALYQEQIRQNLAIQNYKE